MVKRIFVVASVASLTLACGDSGGGADGGTGTETDGTTSSSSTMPATLTGPMSDTTPVTSLTASTTMTTTATTITTTDPDTGTTGGPIGICVGASQVGTLALVHSRQGTAITPGCDNTPAGCGGDLVDTWVIEETCGGDDFPNFFNDDCPGATQAVNDLQVTGSRTFNGDDTYSFDLMSTIDVDVNIDAMTCFGLDCTGYADAASMDPETTATCADAGDGTCDCNVVFDFAEQTTGTYAVAGNILTVTPDDVTEDPEEIEFCIMGDRLDAWSPLVDLEVYLDTFCMDEQDCIDQLADASELYFCVMGDE